MIACIISIGIIQMWSTMRFYSYFVPKFSFIDHYDSIQLTVHKSEFGRAFFFFFLFKFIKLNQDIKKQDKQDIN